MTTGSMLTRSCLGPVFTLAIVFTAGCTAPSLVTDGEDVAASPAGTSWSPQYVLDLSHSLHPGFPWIEVPGVTFPFGIEPIATIAQAGVAANRWVIHEHLGTQIDAPSHFAEGGRSMSDLRPDELVAPIAVIDVRVEAAANPDLEVSMAHLEDWESRYGRIPEGAVVIMNSGWGERINDPARFVNRDDTGTMRFPGFSAEAAIWLAENRHIWGLGVDVISIDPGYDDTFRTHKELEARDGWALEALANLDQLPPRGATLVVGAVNVRDATGGLVRPVAMWSDENLLAPWPIPISGRWRSAAAEPIPGQDGASLYLTRDFEFGENRWSIDFSVHSDVDRTALLFSGHNEGSFSISDERAADGSRFASFAFDSRALRPAVSSVATALSEAGCGSGTWVVGESQDVLEEGCPSSRIPSRDECPAEFDVVRIHNGKLFLGARPPDGFMCTAESRPSTSGGAPLVRVH